MKIISSFKNTATDETNKAESEIAWALKKRELVKDAKVTITGVMGRTKIQGEDKLKGYYIQVKGKSFENNDDVTEKDLIDNDSLQIILNTCLSHVRLPMVSKLTYEPKKGIYAII